MNLIARLTLIDAVYSQPKGQPFDCIQLMNYIRVNEVDHRALPYQEIEIYLDHFCKVGAIQIADQSGEHTRYTVANVNQAAEQNCSAAFLFIQNPISIQ